jgi:drug/metabolite transporter (DMT)-like permease
VLPVLLALISSITHAANSVLIKKGLTHSNPQTAVFFTLGLNTVLLCSVALRYTPIIELWRPAVLLFVIVGTFHPGLTRLLTVRGVEKLGVALAIPLRSTVPMFSAGFATLFLGEKVTIPIFCGTLLIVTGVATLSYRKGAVREARLRYMLFPILSAAISALGTIIYKIGLKEDFLPYPLLAAAVSITTSFLVISLTTVPAKWRTFKLNGGCIPYYVGAGICSGTAAISNSYALFLGKVIIVSPITNTVPLFALAFTAIFLKVVLGAIIISILR